MKRHVMASVFVFVSCCLVGQLRADNRFHLSAESMLAGSNGNEVTVLCDSDLEALSFSYGIRFDPSVLRVESVSNEGTAAAGAEFYEGLIDNENGLIGYGCVFDTDGDFSTQVLAPGNDHVIGVISFEVVAATDAEAALTFETVAIGPNLVLPIRNVLTTEVGNSVQPGLEGATVEIRVPVPEIVVEPGSHDFGEVLIGDSLGREIVVRNEGAAVLEISGIALGAGASDEFSLAGVPAAPVTIAPLAQLSFEVSYSPADEGLDLAMVVISNDDADESEQMVSLQGSGVPVPVPEIVVEPGSHDFGEVLIGDSLGRDIVVRNEGSAFLEISGIALGAGASDEFSLAGVPATPVTIAPKAQLSFEVSYSPSDEGLDSATVVISSDDSDESEVVVSLEGSGVPVPEPEIVVEPVSHDFGEVLIGDSLSRDIVVRNEGAAVLEISGIALGAGASDEFSLAGVPATPIVIAPKLQLSFIVNYSPSDEGLDSATVVISSDDADESEVVVSLEGSGVPVPVPEIVVEPGSHDFDEVLIGDSLMQEIVVRNEGSASLEVTGIALGAGASDEFVLVDAPATPVIVAPKAQLSFEVSYSPTDEGLDSATVVISSDDSDESEVVVSLEGSGIPEVLGGGQVPGDYNQDAGVDISDAISIFGYLFLGGEAPACPEGLDFNGDSGLDLSDGIGALNWLFQGGAGHALGSDCVEIVNCEDACD